MKSERRTSGIVVVTIWRAEVTAIDEPTASNHSTLGSWKRPSPILTSCARASGIGSASMFACTSRMIRPVLMNWAKKSFKNWLFALPVCEMCISFSVKYRNSAFNKKLSTTTTVMPTTNLNVDAATATAHGRHTSTSGEAPTGLASCSGDRKLGLSFSCCLQKQLTVGSVASSTAITFASCATSKLKKEDSSSKGHVVSRTTLKRPDRKAVEFPVSSSNSCGYTSCIPMHSSCGSHAPRSPAAGADLQPYARSACEGFCGNCAIRMHFTAMGDSNSTPIQSLAPALVHAEEAQLAPPSLHDPANHEASAFITPSARTSKIFFIVLMREVSVHAASVNSSKLQRLKQEPTAVLSNTQTPYSGAKLSWLREDCAVVISNAQTKSTIKVAKAVIACRNLRFHLG
mmetsp:Transcript_51689/g.150164  ORF Transcript_51689/g.150164 Transcript_51689/m.150164 type:complete len:401 (+) Transcript_51689:93-1295(+)